ncbi:nuclear transport factor 2 family protein [Rhodococcus sp. NPDC058521]|uniref:nuclear transport factor 2 family protein n=1 Tax=Rhodococcus sp. NPDC058521 TaxID=3346536 RepID=UPI003659B966
MTNTRELVELVEGSPKAVAVHDRDAWLSLFTSDAEVNDPVGSAPHVGVASIGPFYDTFIGPNTISFDVDRDIVCGMTIVRDLHVTTVMSTGATLKVPMHLRYVAERTDGNLKIARLYAHWELPSMITQLMLAGSKGLLASAKLTPQLVSNLGPSGAVGFMRGFVRVSRHGKKSATRFLSAVQQGRVDLAEGLLADDAVLEYPLGAAVTPAQFVELAGSVTWSKVICAGRFVTASIESEVEAGVILFEFGPRGRKIEAVQMLTNRK